MKAKKPILAFCYDFDGTLAPGYMQDHAFIPELGVPSSDFWKEVKDIAKKQKGDQIHAYMHLMLRLARAKDIRLKKSQWRLRGKALPLFPGVEGWFSRQNKRAEELDVSLEHYIISSGIREMIEGSPIAPQFKRIYASAFLYDSDSIARGVILGVNYTNKTQYLFRIHKGTLEEWDDQKINRATQSHQRRVPFDRIAFFGDGETDVPCMRLVTDQGGYSVAVYTAGDAKSEEAAIRLRVDGRAKFGGPADYRENAPLDQLAKVIITEMASRAHSQELPAWPEPPRKKE